MDPFKDYNSEDEDILAQEAYYKSLQDGQKPAAKVVSKKDKTTNKMNSSLLSVKEDVKNIKNDENTIDNNIINEEVPILPMEGVTEKYLGYFLFPDRCESFKIDDSEETMEDAFSTITLEDLKNDYEKKKKRKFVPKKSMENRNDKNISLNGKISCEDGQIGEEDIIKKLEIMNPEDVLKGKLNTTSRIAVDPVAINFEMQMINAIKPRMEKSFFDMISNLGKQPVKDSLNDNLYIEAIKRKDESLKIYFKINDNDIENIKFIIQENIDIHNDGTWCLTPLLKIIDENRHNNNLDGSIIEKIENILLFTYLIFIERPYYFYLRINLSEYLVKIMKLYFVKSLVLLKNDIITQFMDNMLEKYLLPNAMVEKYKLTKDHNIKNIEAIPEYLSQLFQSYEETSMGDVIFTKYILLFTYFNTDPKIMTYSVNQLWDINKSVARIIILKKEDYSVLVDYLYKRRQTNESILCEEQCPLEYAKLLTSYAVSLGKEFVTKNRSSLLYDIAINELKDFFKRHDGVKKDDNNYIPEWEELIKGLKIMLKNIIEFK
uniref:RPAP1_N domain-containing protein n=1 Tax=Parastrongyloides trichosuri TaxID=131310 RepID=A0A0N4ZQX3_PARTI